MSIFSRIADRLHYLRDSVGASTLSVKIERFDCSSKAEEIIVTYRLGRQKLLHQLDIFTFEQEYFGRLSHHDQHRLTKFATFQMILNRLFQQPECRREAFIQHILKESEHESLF